MEHVRNVPATGDIGGDRHRAVDDDGVADKDVDVVVARGRVGLGRHISAEWDNGTTGTPLAASARVTRPPLTLVLCAAASGWGCGSDPELTMNVQVDAQGLSFYARELGSDCTCTDGEWPDPDECVSSSDGVSCTCEPAPASCIYRLRLERGGAELAEVSYDADLGGGERLEADLSASPSELVIVGCGGLARIAIPAVADLPQPSIEDVTDDGEALRIAWSSAPAAASALVVGGDGFVSRVCHDTTGAIDLPSVRPGLAEEAHVSVHTFAAPTSIDTLVGAARVWAGGRAEETVTLLPER